MDRLRSKLSCPFLESPMQDSSDLKSYQAILVPVFVVS
jgi:hypothetical protein